MRAARNIGFVFSGRTPDSVIVETVSWRSLAELKDWSGANSGQLDCVKL